jgi:hypothetical protein
VFCGLFSAEKPPEFGIRGYGKIRKRRLPIRESVPKFLIQNNLASGTQIANNS